MRVIDKQQLTQDKQQDRVNAVVYVPQNTVLGPKDPHVPDRGGEDRGQGFRRKEPPVQLVLLLAGSEPNIFSFSGLNRLDGIQAVRPVRGARHCLDRRSSLTCGAQQCL